PSHPMPWAIKAVLHRGEWPVRHLETVVESPVLRMDGSILSTPGYDVATGLLYIPSQGFDQIPLSPNQADAAAAVQTLLDVVRDFPFATPAHAAAWIASVLTPLARFAFKGPSPLFLV